MIYYNIFAKQINQGMDEKYEAEFFQLLLSENNIVQYFVLSPTENSQIEELLSEAKTMKKRLPDITVHVILCGSTLPESNKAIVVDFNKCLK